MDQNTTTSGLFNMSPQLLKPSEPADAYLEQYKLYLEYLDKLADRRQTANTFFLTLNTGLCAALAFLGSNDAADEIKKLYFVIPFAGIILSVFWQRLVASYRQLSTVKFDIVHKMEEQLPIAPYRAEWELLGGGKSRSKYIPLTHIEVWVPRLFIAMYVLILAFILPASMLSEGIRCSHPAGGMYVAPTEGVPTVSP